MAETPFATVPTVAPVPLWRRVLDDHRLLVPVFLVACAVVGVVLGALWALFAYRPGYVVREDLSAYLTERGLADIFAADALFVFLSVLLGIAAGIGSWLLFRRLGWWICILAVVSASIGSLVAWQFGLLIGPRRFEERLAAAVSGDVVPVDLALHSLSALLVAPFLAITPVMLCAAFWPEDATDVVADERAGELGVGD